MKGILLSCFLLLTTFAFGQTEKHKQVPGTGVSLVPPTGFSPAVRFPGFQNEKAGASIMVTELPSPLQATSEGFTPGALQAKGMQLMEKQSIDFAGGKATYLLLSQQAQGQTFLKQVLLFGDSRKTVMINGVYPETSKALEKDIRAALVSTSYVSGRNSDPFAAVPFRLNVSGTPYRFAQKVTGSLIFSTDGAVPTRTPDKAVIVVANSHSTVTPAGRRQFSLDRLKKLPRGASITTKSITPIAVDRLNGFEIVGEGKDGSNNKQLVYQVMLFDDAGAYYLLVGTAIHNFETHLAHFRTIAQTLQVK
jgi:hypothetical protein